MMHIRLERDSSTFERMPKNTGAARCVTLGPFTEVIVCGDYLQVEDTGWQRPAIILRHRGGEWFIARTAYTVGRMSAVDRKHPFSDVVIY